VRTIIRLLVVTALAGALAVGTALPGSASVVEKGSKQKFCKAALDIGQQASNPSSATTASEAKSFAKLFKKLSKLAPSSKLKSATKEIAKFYSRVAKGESFEDVSASEGESYGKALAVFGPYLATDCLSTAIPSIPSIPGVSIPKIPGVNG